MCEVCQAIHRLSDFFFFFNDTATTEIYTLSLHDALPIFPARRTPATPRTIKARSLIPAAGSSCARNSSCIDRKSTRLNSSHSQISYAVFCLKKKKHKPRQQHADYRLT